MARKHMQNGNIHELPPFPGTEAVPRTTIFRSMGVVSSREGIGAGMIAKNGGVDFYRTDFPRYVMVIVLRGRGYYEDDLGNRYPLDCGTFFQRQPGIRHTNIVEGGSGWVEAYLETGPLFYQSLRAMRIIRSELPVQKLPELPELPEQIWQLIHRLKFASEEELKNLAVIMLELIQRCQRNSGGISPVAGGTESLIERACSVLGTNFSAPVDLHEFCEKNGWGYEHFRKVFKGKIGISPWQYRVRRRLDAASALLQDKQKTIAEIAERLGYSSAYEFSAQFKRYIGISPLYYRGRPAEGSGGGTDPL